jgi:hypothetical protein
MRRVRAFNYDFSAMPNSVFFGSARLVSSGGVNNSAYLSLTDAANDRRGVVVFPALDGGHDVKSITISMELNVRVDNRLLTEYPKPTLNGLGSDPTSVQTAPAMGDFTCVAVDSQGSVSSASARLVVSGPPSMVTEALPNGNVGTACIQNLHAISDEAPYWWSAVGEVSQEPYPRPTSLSGSSIGDTICLADRIHTGRVKLHAV